MSRYLSLLWLTLLTLPDNAKVLRPIFRSTLFLVLSAAIAACSGTTGTESVSLADPFVGTGFHGHTYPGATAPFGMVQLSPDTRNRTWDGSSGYHYSDPTILGFSHTHLSGTGCADLGDFLFLPFIGENIPENLPFSHDDEEASPGYYKVVFPDAGITAELTATVAASAPIIKQNARDNKLRFVRTKNFIKNPLP